MTDNTAASLEALRRKRAYRRGQVTKAETKIRRLQDSDPDDIQPRVVEALIGELKNHIEVHDSIQEQLQELYDEQPDFAVDEEEDCERIIEAHQAILFTLMDLRKALPLWREAEIIRGRVEDALEIPNTDSPAFRETVKELQTVFYALYSEVHKYHHALPPLKDRYEHVKRRVNSLTALAVEANRPATVLPPAVSSTPTTFTSTPTPSHSSLHLELPTFDGDPFEWSRFATTFRTTITNRARGHTNQEIFGHLSRAVKHPEGQDLLRSLPASDMDMEAMLSLLEKRFGSPKILGPLIIKKINSVQHVEMSLPDIKRAYKNYLLPFQKFCTLVGDSLSAYLATGFIGLLADDCKREWSRFVKPNTPPDMKQVEEFLSYWRDELAEGSAADLSMSKANSHQFRPSRPSSRAVSPSRNRHHSNKQSSTMKRYSQHCPLCEESHLLGKCSTFLSYDIDKRNKFARDRKLCINCFSNTHGCKTCPSKFSCRTCNGRHHSTLHRERENSTTSTAATTSDDPNVNTATTDASTARQVRFLYSAQVLLKNGDRTSRARALLDSGAAIPMMTEHLATELNLKRVYNPIPVHGITGTTHCKFMVCTDLYSLDSRFCSDNVTFTVIPSLENQRTPKNRAEILARPDLRHFSLADPELGGNVDLLLGIEQTSDLTTGKPFKIGNLRALPTQLGLCLSGPLGEADQPAVLTLAPTTLSDDLSKLWQLDQVEETSPFSKEETSAIEQFKSTCKIVEGRYSVSLPRIEQAPSLGDSRRQALSRLYSNEKSLSSKEKLTAFQEVLAEYFSLDHAELVPDKELSNKFSYYLPVHAVIKESSSTTKVRAVFDASARTSSGSSLNDQLLPGPSLYPTLPDILTRFRGHNIAVTADISKMFREILLNLEERDWHRFLVRTEDGFIKDARMKRLTFGVKSSPFLASQVLHEHANHHIVSHPVAAKAILQDFYVDDVLTGATNVEDAFHLHKQLCLLLKQAGMNLCKWRTNSDQLRKLIPPHLLEEDSSLIDIRPSPSAQKALGVHWDTQADAFHVAVPDVQPTSQPVTKRMIAAGTAGVFDVLGLFSPVVICARILFQDTWKLGLTWDEDVPEDVQLKWHQWLSDLSVIHNHPVPRKLFPYPSAPDIKLHGFCDASTVAYGAVVYARTSSSNEPAHTALVIAKARVLPTKPTTVPKAELAGAHLLAKLLRHTLDLFELDTQDATAWTDSQIVLHWLPKHPSLLNRFVANRVSAIRDLLPSTVWRHVPSLQNPADLASRGVRAEELTASSLWWKGPNWLSLDAEQWPPPFIAKPSTPIYSVSLKPSFTLPAENLSFLNSLWSLSSNFFTLARVVCYVYRFYSNCKKARNQRVHGPISYTEVLESKHRLYKLSQAESVPELLQAASKSTQLPKHHKMHKFRICLSSYGHVQIQSRVRNPDSPREPMLLTVLSLKSGMTKLLLSSLHKVYGHAGDSATMSILASTYHITGLRNYLKFISRSCPICQRAYAQPIAHSMGMLPASRTTPAPPFDRTGVDFAGPFTIKKGHTRRPVLIKTYAVVFVCLTTKAVHLDLCASLSTEDFMAVLRRFIARRGCPTQIWSDNGTNFQGAREEIRAIQKLHGSKGHQETVGHFTEAHSIEWSHIPPRAPHFGGLWESAVRAMKTVLRKVTAPHPLSWEELYTLLTEAEAILNSRPILPINTDDAEDNAHLTAGHFLVGRPLLAPPTRLPPTGKTSLLKRWNLVTRLTSDLWKTWLSSYLATCAHRAKWTRPGHQLQVGDIVFVKDESFQCRTWPLAIVTQIHPGDDGVARTASIRCHGKIYKRPTCKLILAVPKKNSETSSPSPRPRSMSGTPSQKE